MYKIEKGHTYYFNDDIVVVKINDDYDLECVIDDDGYKLLSSINVESLAIDGGCLVVNGKTRIGLLDKRMPDIKMPNYLETYINTSVLKQALRFAATDKVNPVLTGVYISSEGTVAATDRFKFFCSYEGTTGGTVLSSEFVKALAEYDEVALIKYDNSSVAAILNDGTVVFGRLLQGNFPDIFSLLEPKGCYYTYDPQELEKSVKIGSLVKPTYVEFKDGEVIFHGDINTYVAKTDIPINYKLTLDSVRIMCGYYEMWFQNDSKPILLVDGNEKVLIVGMR